MSKRPILLAGVFAVLGMAYILFFTEWLRPEPIRIASQIRPSILQPRFGRNTGDRGRTMKVMAEGRTNPPVPVDKHVMVPPPGAPPGAVAVEIHGTNMVVRKDSMVVTNQARRARLPDWGEIEQAPGGVANVTFSLDNAYALTSLKVQDVPADGSAPKVVWDLVGPSSPVSSLLYGKVPLGMRPRTAGAQAESLTAGAPYRLIVEAGRRRGTNTFTTSPSAPTQ